MTATKRKIPARDHRTKAQLLQENQKLKEENARLLDIVLRARAALKAGHK